MSFVAVVVKLLTAFSDGKIVVVSAGFSYIKKISPSFAGSYPAAENAFHFLVVILVRHCYSFGLKNYYLQI
jgi:hypothetical protein